MTAAAGPPPPAADHPRRTLSFLVDLFHDALVFVAGLWAGTINAVVGSGTLVTFPVLVALGYAPVAATISNEIGRAHV